MQTMVFFSFQKYHQVKTSSDQVVHRTVLVYMWDQGSSIYYPVHFLQNRGSKSYKADMAFTHQWLGSPTDLKDLDGQTDWPWHCYHQYNWYPVQITALLQPSVLLLFVLDAVKSCRASSIFKLVHPTHRTTENDTLTDSKVWSMSGTVFCKCGIITINFVHFESISCGIL